MSPSDKQLGLNVLCVEDDPDTAEVLGELLRREGYTVVAAPSAAAAAEELGKQRFHLVLSDYMLPDKTGTAMLREAKAAGLLDGSSCLLFTAHPDPDRFDGLEILRKPLAVDAFLRKVFEILAPAREREVENAKQRLKDTVPDPGLSAGAEARAEFILYVSAASPASLRALRNMQELLAAYDMSQVKFSVVDLARDLSPTIEEDRIAFTPTLVQRHPAPRTWILGDLQDIRIVADLLLHAGVDRKKG